MSATRQYTRQCEGKRGFSTPEKARKEISRSHAHAKVTEYFCPWCRFWHVGHKRGSREA
jgi:hypothetical protein